MENYNYFIFDRFHISRKGKNPYFVAESQTGYIIVGDYQYLNGNILFLCKQRNPNSLYLDGNYKVKYLIEMGKIADAILTTFHAYKVFCELLRTGDTRIHWSVTPHTEETAHANGPLIWHHEKMMICANAVPTESELKKIKTKLYMEIIKKIPVLG